MDAGSNHIMCVYVCEWIMDHEYCIAWKALRLEGSISGGCSAVVRLRHAIAAQADTWRSHLAARTAAT